MLQKVIGFFKQEIPDMFCKDNHLIGWMIWWRTVLISLGCMAVVMLLMAGIGKLFGAANLFDFTRIWSNIIMIPVSIFILNITGKMVARKKLQKEITQFIGWSIFWRSFLWALTMIFLSGVVLLLLAFIVPPVLILFLFAAIYISLITYGWGARKVYSRIV